MHPATRALSWKACDLRGYAHRGNLGRADGRLGRRAPRPHRLALHASEQLPARRDASDEAASNPAVRKRVRPRRLVLRKRVPCATRAPARGGLGRSAGLPAPVHRPRINGSVAERTAKGHLDGSALPRKPVLLAPPDGYALPLLLSTDVKVHLCATPRATGSPSIAMRTAPTADPVAASRPTFLQHLHTVTAIWTRRVIPRHGDNANSHRPGAPLVRQSDTEITGYSRIQPDEHRWRNAPLRA